jgi:hypothetical protein
VTSTSPASRSSSSGRSPSASGIGATVVLADLAPLRDRDTRWVIGGAVAWSVLDICLGLFGGLFLLRAGGGLLSAALWLLPLGFALALVFLAGRRAFARVGTRPFRLASPVGAMVVAVAFASLGSRAAEPLITVSLSSIWALAQGLHWSAFNLVEFRRVPAADRAHYFALLSRLGLLVAATVPLAVGWFLGRFADLTGYRTLFATLAVVGIVVFVAAWRTPTHRTETGTGRLRDSAATPAARWALAAIAVRGLWDLGGQRIMLPLLLLSIIGSEEGFGVYQAANSIALFVGFSLSARSLARVGVVRALQIGMLGMLAANVLFVATAHAWILFVVVPLGGVFVALWGNAAFVANQLLIDRVVSDDGYTFIVARELALGAGRTVAAVVAIAAAAAFGDGAARPLMAAYALSPAAAAYCLDRALGPDGRALGPDGRARTAGGVPPAPPERVTDPV